MSQLHRTLARDIRTLLTTLVRRTGAESASLVHPAGRVLLSSGSPLPADPSVRILPPGGVAPVLMPSADPALGALFTSWLTLGRQPVALVVRCNAPTTPRFQQVILAAGADLQALLDAFGLRDTLVLDQWFP